MVRPFSFLSLRVLWTGLLAVVVAGVGCGKTRFKMVPVEGKISIANGKPIPAGTRLRFDPVEGSAGTATAEIGADGTFKLTHVSGQRGAEIGKYTITLLPPTDNQAEFLKTVPKEYYEGSMLSAEVKEGMGPLDLKIGR
jgi:hypothetical protein